MYHRYCHYYYYITQPKSYKKLSYFLRLICTIINFVLSTEWNKRNAKAFILMIIYVMVGSFLFPTSMIYFLLLSECTFIICSFSSTLLKYIILGMSMNFIVYGLYSWRLFSILDYSTIFYVSKHFQSLFIFISIYSNYSYPGKGQGTHINPKFRIIFGAIIGADTLANKKSPTLK